MGFTCSNGGASEQARCSDRSRCSHSVHGGHYGVRLQLPNYHTSNGIAALLDVAVLIGIVSVGVGVTMIAGEFDSVGSLAALTGVISLEIIGIGVLPALVVGVLFAAAVGVIQGLLIGVLGINSLVFTIGTLIGLRGLAMVVAHEQTITMPIEQLPDVDILTKHFLGVFSPISVGMIVVFVAVGLFLKYTLWDAKSTQSEGGATRLGPRACLCFGR